MMGSVGQGHSADQSTHEFGPNTRLLISNMTRSEPLLLLRTATTATDNRQHIPTECWTAFTHCIISKRVMCWISAAAAIDWLSIGVD